MSWIFENHTLKALNIPFKKVVLPGRFKCGGTEGDSGGSWLPKEKKLICGPEGEIVVAHGRLSCLPRSENTNYRKIVDNICTVVFTVESFVDNPVLLNSC